jgi:hypothetical protein
MPWATAWSLSSSVNIVTGLRIERWEFNSRLWQGFFSLRHRIWTGSGAYPAFFPMGYEGSFPEGGSDLDVKMTTHLHLVTRLRMNGAIYPSTPAIRLYGMVLS